MKKLRIYVGCGLTHAPKTYKKQIEKFKDELRKISWVEILDFVTSVTVGDWEKMDSAHIYHNDIHVCVGTAHVMIGDMTHPSTGLGWELGTSVEKHKICTMLCAKNKKRVSHLPVGASKKNKHVTFHLYEKTILELVPYFTRRLKKLHKAM